MYTTFYGLKENPFDVTPNPEYIYLGGSHREALAQLLYGVKAKKGFIVITGEVGTGKTTLLHYLLDNLDGNSHTRTAFLFNPRLTVSDFIQFILKDLGVGVLAVVEHAGDRSDAELGNRFTEKKRESDVDDGFFSRMEDKMIGSGNAGAVQERHKS
jgi:type II secretory pathway predicted ATPase ExeA